MKKQDIIYIILSIIMLSFFLNLFWEFSHSLLYDWNLPPLENNVYFFIPRILISTLGDVFYIGMIFIFLFLFRKGFSWAYNPQKIDYMTLAILGIIFAVFIELRAEYLGLWQYNQFMPTIFGIGLTPLIQLSTTSILILFILNKVILKNEKNI